VRLNWATIQKNLGITLQRLGQRENGTERLEEARRAIGLACDVYREVGMYRYNILFETRLREIDDLIASRRSEGN
jgi:hypothetical protein